MYRYLTNVLEFLSKLLRQGNGSFKNEICSIEYKNKCADFGTFIPPLFGAELNFNLSQVVDCPEFLAYFPLIVK
jgi:mRNA (guanine-N7-)-methyltransferase